MVIDMIILRLFFRDKIKTEYCKNNNIKLLRIPYWESDSVYTLEKYLWNR